MREMRSIWLIMMSRASCVFAGAALLYRRYSARARITPMGVPISCASPEASVPMATMPFQQSAARLGELIVEPPEFFCEHPHFVSFDASIGLVLAGETHHSP